MRIIQVTFEDGLQLDLDNCSGTGSSYNTLTESDGVIKEQSTKYGLTYTQWAKESNRVVVVPYHAVRSVVCELEPGDHGYTQPQRKGHIL